MRNWWALCVAMAAAIVLAVFATTPHGAAPASAAATTFSAERAMGDIRVIARAPHPTGSAEDAAVRAHLIARLRSMGLQASEVTGTMDAVAKQRLDTWRGSPQPAPPLTNIVAVLPGRDRAAPAVVLMAHHDSVWGSPGAADDGAGVASVLETVRAIRASGRQPERDLIVLLTDGEELGLEGAKAWFANAGHVPVGVIVNLETRGGGGRTQMFETGADNGAMMDLFGANVARPVATSLSVFIYKKLPNSTDYTVAKKMGVPGFNFAFIGRPGLYHSPLATPDRLDQGAVQDMGRQVLDLTRALLAAPALPGAAPDRVFFDAFGLFFVNYAAPVGWLILGLGIVGYVVAGWRRATVGEVLRGAGALIALVLIAGVLLYVVNGVSGAWGPVNYYDRLAAIPRLQVQALLVCLAALTLVRGHALRPEVGHVVGAAVPLMVLGLFVQASAPTAAYPIAVPLMLGGLAALVGRFSPGGGTIAAAIAAALVVGYMLGFAFFLLQGVGPGMPMIAALPLAISTVVLMPLFGMVARRNAQLVAVALLIVAVGIALWVRLDPIAPSVAVYSSDH